MTQRLNEWLKCGVGLAVDVQSNGRPRFQEFAQSRDVFDAMDLDLLRLREGDVTDLDVDTAGAKQVFIMKGQQNAIFRRVYVGFEIPIAELHCMGECGHRVLGMHTGTATMSKGDRLRRVEIGMHEKCGEAGLDGTAQARPVFVLEEPLVELAGRVPR